MKKYLLLFWVFFLIPVFSAGADTISSDTTWSPTGGVYVISSDFSVASGTTLTIEPGTIIKARTTGMGGPSIYGQLIAHGTSESPIYFTSIYDDSVGGDSDGGGLSAGEPGQWQGLYFKPGSERSFEYVNISYAGYGGYGYGNFVGIENDGGVLDIINSNIYDNYRTLFDWGTGYYRSGSGIRNKAGSLSVSDSIIKNHAFGVMGESGTISVSRTQILDNTSMGLYIQSLDSVTLFDDHFSGNGRTAQLSASSDFAHEGNTSDDLSYRGFEITGPLRDGAIWHSRDLPILITQGEVTVLPGNTLTLEPGTIVKFGNPYRYGAIVVHGNLISRGAPNNKIYFTSTKDDTVGGDTNADGEATLPVPRDWNAIFLESGSSAVFENSVVRYSGFNFNGEYLPGVAAAIYNRGANLLIKESLIEHNWGASIFQDAGTTNISQSKLAYSGYGLQFRAGNATISQSSLHGHSGQAVYNQSGYLSQFPDVVVLDAINNWWGSADGPWDISTSTPTGTGDRVSVNVLYDPWLTSDPLLIEQDPDPVVIIPGIMGSAYKNGQLVIDPILHTYDDLIATLIVNGYVEGKDLFTFPYEWRDSNVFTANLLDDKIEAVKSICGCGKVDIVAHSMGGLVARAYIQSVDYDSDVDQIIFLGTPHRGSVVDYIKWEAGQFIPEFFDTLIGMFFQAESARNGYSTVFEYIRNKNKPILSVQELLPTFDYLKDKSTGIVRTYPNNYPQNYFLESLNNNVSNLLNSGVEITNIVGNSGLDTIEKIRVMPSTHSGLWEHGEPDGFYTVFGDQGLENGTGDGTVTIFGATLDNSISNENSNTSHRRLPTMEGNYILKILTGKTSTTNIDSGFNISPIVLLLQLKSPIDVVITAPDGKKIGKNFSNGAEYDEIPSAFYSGYQTDNEYITILNPLDGEYTVEVQGTGSGGEYGVLTSYVSDITSVTTETSGLTEPSQITTLNIAVDNNNPEVMVPERIITSEVLLNDIIKSYELGWITDKKLKDSLVRQAKQIIKTETAGRTIDKKVARALLTELKGYKAGKMNEQAYNIIKTDLEWLINN